MAWRTRSAAMAILALALAPALAGAGEFGARGLPIGKDGVVSKANLDAGEQWPLTIPRATVVCEDEAVFLAADGIQYPLNGVAKTLAKTHPDHRRPLEEIWMPDEKTMQGMEGAQVKVEMVRVDITPVLERAVAWCRRR